MSEIVSSINDIETSLTNGDMEIVDSKVETFYKKLLDFLTENNLIVESAKKFMVDEGQAIQVSDVISKGKNSNNLEEFLDYSTRTICWLI